MATSLTQDSISLRGAGVVTVVQQKKGARFSLDSILLADFCRIKSWDRVLEPGAGTGVVSLLLAKKYPRSHIIAIEVQPATAKLCRRNIEENHLENRITLLEEDITAMKRHPKLAPFDVIVANPPYHRTGTGKQSPDPERLASRHDRLGDISAWLDLQRFLKNRGSYVMSFPADRLADLIALLRSRSLEPKRMRMVHPYQNKPASLFLLEAVKSAGIGIQVLAPLVVHEADGGYTEELKAIYGPPGISSPRSS